MTVFPDGAKERLHGHNYTVGVGLDLREVSFTALLDLGTVAGAVAAQCREWNERLLLPERCPALEIVRRDDAELEFRLQGKRYVVPADDAILLPVDNVIVENLSIEFARRFVARMGAALRRDLVTGVEVEVSEIPGLGGSYYWTWD